MGEDGFEPSKLKATDLQSAPFGHSGILPLKNPPTVAGRIVWSWWTDSNPRPADYKSAALPTELHQRFFSSLEHLFIISHLFEFVNPFFELFLKSFL